jgi:hypothetical protein
MNSRKLPTFIAILACATSCSDGSSGPDGFCLDDDWCPEGHPCLLEYDICDPFCHSELCPEHEECSSERGTCIPVGCGELNPCDAGEICNPESRTCVDAAGTCRSRDDCPAFDNHLLEVVDLDCKAGFCRISPIDLEVSGLDGEGSVTVTSPSGESVIADPEDLLFRWESTGIPAILLVFDAVPATTWEMMDRAIWGYASPEDAVPEVRWIDGRSIVDGEWQPDAGIPPFDKSLYLLVQVLSWGDLEAQSTLVPFRIGSGWSQPDDPCTSSSSIFGDCFNPTSVLICHEGRCRIACASHLDCSEWDLGCGEFDGGLRLCQ